VCVCVCVCHEGRSAKHALSDAMYGVATIGRLILCLFYRI